MNTTSSKINLNLTSTNDKSIKLIYVLESLHKRTQEIHMYGAKEITSMARYMLNNLKSVKVQILTFKERKILL